MSCFTKFWIALTLNIDKDFIHLNECDIVYFLLVVVLKHDFGKCVFDGYVAVFNKYFCFWPYQGAHLPLKVLECYSDVSFVDECFDGVCSCEYFPHQQ